ncbi:MAG: hypothetical protein AAF652_06990 [Cyanobacteria bacterium P01_C01_bin.72]
MNASSQAITPKLASRIAHLAVLFRTEFSNATVDLSPWLTDAETQSQLDPNSIDLSFYFPKHTEILACQCVFLQVYFSEDLLRPNCQLREIQAYGYSGLIHPEQQWQFSTEDWTFIGSSIPETEHQERFKSLVGNTFSLFKHTNQIR